ILKLFNLKCTLLIIFVELCSSQTSSDSCQAASTTNVTCLWCSKASKCSNGQDVYTALWQQKKCNESSEDENMTTAPFIERKEIVSNETGKTLKLSAGVARKRYINVALPIVISVLILGFASVVGILLYKKKANKLNKLYHFSHIHRQLNSIFQ
ncbi:unnamed protein product, partial [Schistosoma turkestanicum]